MGLEYHTQCIILYISNSHFLIFLKKRLPRQSSVNGLKRSQTYGGSSPIPCVETLHACLSTCTSMDLLHHNISSGSRALAGFYRFYLRSRPLQRGITISRHHMLSRATSRVAGHRREHHHAYVQSMTRCSLTNLDFKMRIKSCYHNSTGYKKSITPTSNVRLEPI